MKKIMRILAVFTAITVLTVSSAAFTGTAYAQESQETAWADSIEEMLAAGNYNEGEVLVVIDNAKANRKKMQQIDAVGEDEFVASVSDDAVEETLNVDVKNSESAADIRLITNEGKTTRELLYELAEDDCVLYAEPNYVKTGQYAEEEDAEDADAQDAGEDGPQETADSGEPDENEPVLALENTSAEVEAAIPTKIPQDLIETKGYNAVGDLSGLQRGYGAESDLYSLNAPSWNTTGGTNVSGKTPVVAVVDSGIDYTHPDLVGQIVDMTDYTSLGGRYGYNCSNDGNAEDEVMDDSGHGSHCAGIIAASWDGTGTSGIASGVQLCIVKASNDGLFMASGVVRAFSYLADAVDNGLNLYSVNCSFGGEGISNTELLALNELGKRGVVVCVAAGNSTNDNDEYDDLSSAFSVSPYVVVVDSTTFTEYPSDFTCYGQTISDVFSPGDAILSTVNEDSASYFAMEDEERVSYTGFTSGAGESGASIGFYGVIDTEETELLDFDSLQSFADSMDSLTYVSVGTAYADSFDGDGSVCELQVPALDSSGKRALYVLKIPVSEENTALASAACAALKSSLNRCNVWLRSFTFDVPGGQSVRADVASSTGWKRPNNVWVNMSQTCYQVKEGDITGIPYYDGCMYYIIEISDRDATNTESRLYVDSVGLGYNMLRYDYFQGTSMATPAMSASAAVVYDQLACAGKLDGLTASEKAVYVANTVKAKVDQGIHYDGLCTSEGAFDFAVAEDAYAPVINTVTENAQTLTLTGQYFGSKQGSAVLNGSACSIVKWNDTQITLKIPEGTKNGRLSLDLTAANGKTTTRKVVLRDQSSGRATFEYQVTIPDAIANCLFKSMTSMDGVLYVVPETLGETASLPITMDQFWSYDPAKDEWKQLSSIPFESDVKNSDGSLKVTIGASDGVIAACVSYCVKEERYIDDVKFCQEYKDTIYLYDTQHDRWVKAQSAESPLQNGEIFGTEFGIFYYNGQTVSEEDADGVKHTVSADNTTFYRLDFSKADVSSGTGSVSLQLKDAGALSRSVGSMSTVTCYKDTLFISGSPFRWLKWSDTEQKFTGEVSASLPGDMMFVGSQGDPVCFAANYTGAITPEGALVLAFNGDDFLQRGYDSFFISQDGNVTPYDKNVALADIYNSIAAYSSGYLYVWGNTFYNTDETIGYLVYTKYDIDDPEPDPDPSPTPDPSPVPSTGDTNKPGLWVLLALLAAAVAAAFAAGTLKARRRKSR